MILTVEHLAPLVKPSRNMTRLYEAPKSFFTALFIRTSLGTALEMMMLCKAVPDGPKPKECEWGSGHKKPPITYIPEKDELQEGVEAAAYTLKITLPGKVEV
jgi:hypothetical protein